MDASAFFELAIELSAGPDEVHLRSAISRAYYAAFHRAHEFLRSIGIMLPSGPECHQKLRWILDNAGDPDVEEASIRLNSLRAARNAADYDLADSSAVTKKFTITKLQTADQIIKCFDLCFPGGPKQSIHAALRAYAKDTLKLKVS